MISVVVWKWKTPGYRSHFGPQAVNTMRRMVARNLSLPHRFICVTNDPAGLDPSIELVPDREDFADLPSPHGGGNPSCYRRLRLYALDAVETFGNWIVSVDLDAVITGPLDPLWDRPDEFVAWRDPIHRGQYNGSMQMLRAGSRPSVWTRFNPKISPRDAARAGFKGSDQAWITYCLPGESVWTRDDGVYSFSVDGMDRRCLPADARIVMMHGRRDPWSPEVQELAWVREHWR